MQLHYLIFGGIIAFMIVCGILATNFIMGNIQRLHEKCNTSLSTLNAEIVALKKKFHMPTLMKGLGFNRKVLCVDVDQIIRNTMNNLSGSLISVDLGSIPHSSYHLLDRDLVDAKLPSITAKEFPQLIGYTVIRHNGKILTYSRGKGVEERLNKLRSFGFGGHIDIEDVFSAMQENKPTYLDILAAGILREIQEELGLPEGYQNQWKEQVRGSLGTTIIRDLSNEVGTVHLGLVSFIDIADSSIVDVDLSEISDPVWLSPAELSADQEKYESWSRILIQEI